MYILAAITVAVFGLGYWSAHMRISQLGGQALPVSTKLIFGVFGLVLAAIAAMLISDSGLARILAEFFVLCFGQTVGYILSGTKKKG